MSTVPEGWYADPQDPTPGAERWWNGFTWTAHTRHLEEQPRPAPAPAEPAPAYAPEPAVQPPDQPRRLADGTPVALLGPRIVAYLVDVVLVNVAASVLLAVMDAFAMLPELFGEPGLDVWLVLGAPAKAVLMLGLWIGYQVYCLTRGRPTLGKRFVGLRVRRLEGGDRLTSRDALLRALAGGGGVVLLMFPGSQVLGLALLGYDAYRMQEDPLQRPWHDQQVGTVVVTAPPAVGSSAR
jgi:uncharacterized RDD family membrane protein YckC